VRRFIFALVKDEWVADDLIQEPFIKVQKNLVQSKEESKLSSWIFRIAYSLCQDHFRKMSQSSKSDRVLTEKKIVYLEEERINARE
jgi:RNA polymerase sigma-70 factor (ECF subfamily)